MLRRACRTKLGTGAKFMRLCDDHGAQPWVLAVSSSSGETSLLEPLLEQGLSPREPARLIYDRTLDGDVHRGRIRQRGIERVCTRTGRIELRRISGMAEPPTLRAASEDRTHRQFTPSLPPCRRPTRTRIAHVHRNHSTRRPLDRLKTVLKRHRHIRVFRLYPRDPQCRPQQHRCKIPSISASLNENTDPSNSAPTPRHVPYRETDGPDSFRVSVDGPQTADTMAVRWHFPAWNSANHPRRCGSGSLGAIRRPPNAIGSVAQLVRAPPCHGGGRGFESRRSR